MPCLKRCAALAMSTVLLAAACFGTTRAAGSQPIIDPRIADLESEISYRIVGGTLAAEGAWPWQVAIYTEAQTGYHIVCGGSIIHERWIMTAAHCISSTDSSKYFVVEGTNRVDRATKATRSTRGRSIKVERIIAHESYNSKTIANDIALIKLASPAKSKPVRLSFGAHAPLETPGQMASVTGWGLLRAFDKNWKDFTTQELVSQGDPRYFTDRLMQVDLPLIDCSIAPYKNVDQRHICAGYAEGGKDACRGDSGGPLVTKSADGRYSQIGIISFGVMNCASAGTYGVYSKVSAFEGWIKEKSGLQFTGSGDQIGGAPPKPEQPAPPAKPPANPIDGNNPAQVAVDFVQGTTLKVGQTVQFKVTTRQPGYLLLLDVTPDRKTTQIFPNARSVATQSGTARQGYITANRSVIVPDPKNPYEGLEFRVDPPFGEGLLVAIVSPEPLNASSLPEVPRSMDRHDALDYLARLSDELNRNLEVSEPAGSKSFSFATKAYRVVP